MQGGLVLIIVDNCSLSNSGGKQNVGQRLQCMKVCVFVTVEMQPA